MLGAGASSGAKIGIYDVNASNQLVLGSNEIAFTMEEPQESLNWLVAGDFNPENDDFSIMICEKFRFI